MTGTDPTVATLRTVPGRTTVRPAMSVTMAPSGVRTHSPGVCAQRAPVVVAAHADSKDRNSRCFMRFMNLLFRSHVPPRKHPGGTPPSSEVVDHGQVETTPG